MKPQNCNWSAKILKIPHLIAGKGEKLLISNYF